MTKQTEQQTISGDATNLRKPEFRADTRKIVHAFTLHARSNGAIKEPPKVPTADSTEGALLTTDADTQVRYKKRTSYSEFCRLGNTFDMTGQLA